MYHPLAFDDDMKIYGGFEEIIDRGETTFGPYLYTSGDMLVDYKDEHLYLGRNHGRTFGPGLAIDKLDVLSFIHVFENGRP